LSVIEPIFSLYNEIMYFPKLYFLVHLHQTLFAFKNPENRSSITSDTLSTKNKWPNFNEHVIAMEKEWDESNTREFIKLVE